jgi:hypothetical protein
MVSSPALALDFLEATAPVLAPHPAEIRVWWKMARRAGLLTVPVAFPVARPAG